MFAVMRETDYYNKPQFRENFWNDWRRLLGKNHVIQKLDDCDFTPIYEWHLEEKEKKKQMSTEVIKNKNFKCNGWLIGVSDLFLLLLKLFKMRLYIIM